jgi:hypothetical protein
MQPKKLTREQVEQIVREARERGERPDLSKADLSWADLSWANLTEANLTEANLSGTDLSYADLSEADLTEAILTQTNLNGTNFSNTILADTSFIKVDLSQAKGLADVQHQGPSIIDINTIYQSKDKIPKEFLEGAGVHPDIIRWQHSLHTQPTVAGFNKVKQRPLESFIISVWEGIIGGVIGSISGVIIAVLIGLVISIIASAYDHEVLGLGNLILLGGIIGLFIGFITGLLSSMTDSSLYGGWEWAIIGAFAGLSLLLIPAYKSFGTFSGYSFPSVIFLVVGIIVFLIFYAIPSAVVAYFIITHRSNVVRSRYITVRSRVIYIVAIVLMTVVAYGLIEVVS